MKEVTYGWYPSVKDVYKPKNRPGSYHLECLYKHGDSMYYQGQMAPPQPELVVLGHRSKTPSTPQGNRRSKSVPVPRYTRAPKLNIPTPTQCWTQVPAETTWGVVGDTAASHGTPSYSDVSWPLPHGKKQQKRSSNDRAYQRMFQKQLMQQHIQQQQQERQDSPQYAWGFKPADLEIPTSSRSEGGELSWPAANRPASNRPHTATTDRSDKQAVRFGTSQKQRPSSSPVKYCSNGQDQRGSPVRHAPAPPGGERTCSNKLARAKSASVRREKTPLPERPVTAASARPESCTRQIVINEQEVKADSIPSRPQAPVPFIYDVNENLEYTEDEVNTEDVRGDETYEAILDRYGWLAEVHGDPYKLKRPLKRVSYAVECPEPEVLPEPPGVHIETNEPFFLNTIPRRPLSFSIHKEWASEHLLAKRIEKQKKDGGIMYNYKKFAFAY